MTCAPTPFSPCEKKERKTASCPRITPGRGEQTTRVRREKKATTKKGAGARPSRASVVVDRRVPPRRGAKGGPPVLQREKKRAPIEPKGIVAIAITCPLLSRGDAIRASDQRPADPKGGPGRQPQGRRPDCAHAKGGGGHGERTAWIGRAHREQQQLTEPLLVALPPTTPSTPPHTHIPENRCVPSVLSFPFVCSFWTSSATGPTEDLRPLEQARPHCVRAWRRHGPLPVHRARLLLHMPLAGQRGGVSGLPGLCRRVHAGARRARRDLLRLVPRLPRGQQGHARPALRYVLFARALVGPRDFSFFFFFFSIWRLLSLFFPLFSAREHSGSLFFPPSFAAPFSCSFP